MPRTRGERLYCTLLRSRFARLLLYDAEILEMCSYFSFLMSPLFLSDSVGSRGLVPLHNACSYGHFEVTEMLIKHGANVNAMDLWQFTPLHEAASKSRVEVCSLLLSEGADPTLLNCHSKSAIDVAPTRELQERLACE